MGRNARKVCTIMAAVFAVALMMAVPLITAVDTDAAFTETDAGYTAKSENPTDSEILTYYLESRESLVLENKGVWLFLRIFDVGEMAALGVPTVTQDKLTLLYGEGGKIYSDSLKSEVVDEFNAENVKMEFTATGSGTLFSNYEYYLNGYEEAGNAIKASFGDSVAEGDKLIITGNIKTRYATQAKYDYAAVDDTKSVVKDKNDSFLYIYSVDVTIEFKSGTVSKTVSFSSDKKYCMERDYTVDYKGKEYSQLVPGDMCRYVNDPDRYTFESGGSHFTVGDKKYEITHDAFPPTTVDQPVDIQVNSELNLNAAKDFIAGYPNSAGNVTVEKTYSSVDSALSSIAEEVALNDIIFIILLIVGVVVAVVVIILILVIVLLILKKKKNSNQ